MDFWQFQDVCSRILHILPFVTTALFLLHRKQIVNIIIFSSHLKKRKSPSFFSKHGVLTFWVIFSSIWIKSWSKTDLFQLPLQLWSVTAMHLFVNSNFIQMHIHVIKENGRDYGMREEKPIRNSQVNDGYWRKTDPTCSLWRAGRWLEWVSICSVDGEQHPVSLKKAVSRYTSGKRGQAGLRLSISQTCDSQKAPFHPPSIQPRLFFRSLSLPFLSFCSPNTSQGREGFLCSLLIAKRKQWCGRGQTAWMWDNFHARSGFVLTIRVTAPPVQKPCLLRTRNLLFRFYVNA